jgi:hypothetical protein
LEVTAEGRVVVLGVNNVEVDSAVTFELQASHMGYGLYWDWFEIEAG